MKWGHVFENSLIFFLILGFLSCASQEEKAEKHFRQGFSHQDQSNLDEAIETTIDPGGATSRAEARSLVGESPWAHNMYEDGHVWVEDTEIVADGASWRVTLPACSLTAIEIHP